MQFLKALLQMEILMLLPDGLDALKIPSFLQKPLLSLFENSANNSNSITLGNYLGNYIIICIYNYCFFINYYNYLLINVTIK